MPRMVDKKADAACGCIGFLGVYKIYKFEVVRGSNGHGC